MTDVRNEPRVNLVELTVSELSAALKRTIEDGFGHVRVRGELGNVKYHSQRPCLSRPQGRQGLPRRRDLAPDRTAHQAQAGSRARGRGHRPHHHLPGPVKIPDRDRDARARRTRRADGAGRGAQEEACRRRPVRPRAQAVAAVPAGGDRRHHLADRRGDPRHPASPRRPISAARAGLAGAGAGRRLGGTGGGRDQRLQCADARRAHPAARPPDRRARRRLARRLVVVQRGDRGARRGRPA